MLYRVMILNILGKLSPPLGKWKFGRETVIKETKTVKLINFFTAGKNMFFQKLQKPLDSKYCHTLYSTVYIYYLISIMKNILYNSGLIAQKNVFYKKKKKKHFYWKYWEKEFTQLQKIFNEFQNLENSKDGNYTLQEIWQVKKQIF